MYSILCFCIIYYNYSLLWFSFLSKDQTIFYKMSKKILSAIMAEFLVVYLQNNIFLYLFMRKEKIQSKHFLLLWLVCWLYSLKFATQIANMVSATMHLKSTDWWKHAFCRKRSVLYRSKNTIERSDNWTNYLGKKETLNSEVINVKIAGTLVPE